MRRPSRERTLQQARVRDACFIERAQVIAPGLHTAQSCRGWHKKRNIGVSGTSSERHIRGRRKRQIYRLPSGERPYQPASLEAEFWAAPRGNIRIAADSTMLRMVNRLMALSFGVHREQLEHRIGFTCPRPFLLRPLDEERG